MALRDQLGAWQAAGIVDAETGARIEAFEASRSAAENSGEGISAGEAIAYIGSDAPSMIAPLVSSGAPGYGCSGGRTLRVPSRWRRSDLPTCV